VSAVTGKRKMSKTFLLTGRNFYLAVASVRIKALAVFVVLCIFANALVPKFALDAKDYSTLCQIMKSQSALFEFFSFSTLPIKIVNEIFNEQRGASAASQRKAPRDDTSNASNTSSDFSITGAAFQDVSRFLSQRGADFGGGGALAVFAKNLSVLPGSDSGNPPVIPLIAFILLMFYFLRARSALPDAAIIMPVKGSKISRLVTASRDFSLSINSKKPVILEIPNRESRFFDEYGTLDSGFRRNDDKKGGSL
jgi:hypothetical protein